MTKSGKKALLTASNEERGKWLWSTYFLNETLRSSTALRLLRYAKFSKTMSTYVKFNFTALKDYVKITN